MRAVILGLAGLFVAGNASAADYLRGSTFDGPPAGYNWAGVYAGAQIGYENSSSTFGTTPRSFVDPLIRPTIESNTDLNTWRQLPGSDARSTGYGAFVGYNSQWGNVVIGAELNYTHSGAHVTSNQTVFVDTSGQTNVPGSLGRIDYNGDLRITDYGTLGVRAGYAMGWLLPYAGVGVAMGRADAVRTAVVSYPVPPAPTGMFPYTDTLTANGQMTFGYSARLGVDIGLFPGVFVRGEYEFVQLKAIKGMEAQLNTFRLAAAVKF